MEAKKIVDSLWHLLSLIKDQDRRDEFQKLLKITSDKKDEDIVVVACEILKEGD